MSARHGLRTWGYGRPMEWIIVVLAFVALPVAAVVSLARLRGRFDRMIEPADDLKRADDGERRGLAERDGTGGFL